MNKYQSIIIAFLIWAGTIVMLSISMKASMGIFIKLFLIYTALMTWWLSFPLAGIVFIAFQYFEQPLNRMIFIAISGLIMAHIYLFITDKASGNFSVYYYENLRLKMTYSYLFGCFILLPIGCVLQQFRQLFSLKNIQNGNSTRRDQR